MKQTGERTGLDSRFFALLLCFFLSGLAGLIYETAWTRQFAFVFGTSELAVATVLAAYMGGLAAGAAIAGRLVQRVRRPVLTYGLLELGIALAALAVPFAIEAARGLYVASFGTSHALPSAGGVPTALFYLACTFAILLVPTALMGATLPLLARHAVRSEVEIGSRIGTLYATNTLGAVAGTVLAGFVFLPSLGLQRTVWVAAAVNGIIFAAAALLARGAVPPLETPPERRLSAHRAVGSWILPLVFVSGVASFLYEVLWTRLLGHLLGGSVYAFATMLASFLVGIFLGSAAAARLATRPDRAARGFAWAQLGIALLSFAAFLAVNRMPELALAVSRQLGSRTTGPLLADACIGALTLLPAALCIGATFPFAVRVLARHESEASRATARVFAWNTLGAIVGSIAAGFVVIPGIGYAGTLTLAMALNFVLATGAALGVRPRRWPVAGLALIGLAGLALVRVTPPWNVLRSSPLNPWPKPGALVHYGVGRSATVLLLGQPGSRRLTSNGLPEASIQPPHGRTHHNAPARWLTVLPVLARPQTRSLLLVGLGGGVAIESLPRSVESIQVVELEPEMIEANRATASWRRRDPLSDPRLELVVNDARNALLLTDRRFDAIASQPSHPWTVGASHLYTREFFELARAHLNPEGVLVQWIGARYIDMALLRSLVVTLLEVFPYVRLYEPKQNGLLLLASDAPLPVEQTVSQALALAPGELGEAGVFRGEDVLAALLLDEEGARRFAAGAPPSTDDRNLLQMRSPRIARSAGRGSFDRDLLEPYDPLMRSGLTFDVPRLAQRVATLGFRERAVRVAQGSPDPSQRALGQGLVWMAAGRERRAERFLRRALKLDPGNEAAQLALLGLHRAEVVEEGGTSRLLPGGAADSAATLIAAWRFEKEENWTGLRDLEPSLARYEVDQIPYAPAARSRALWRLELGGKEEAEEAIGLLDPAIVVTGSPELLLLRARAAIRAGSPGVAQPDLRELLQRQQWNGLPPRIASQARRLRRALAAQDTTTPFRSGFPLELRHPLR